MRTRHRVRTHVMMFSSVLLVLLLGIMGTASAKKKPIRIGEINSYSGLATVYTFPYRSGIQMALKEINDAGCFLGRQQNPVCPEKVCGT